jgi:site-specific DNA-methyltransferase (adenine-specific)
MVELHEGDCLEVMQGIPDGSVDLILCDLPYGTTACKWDSVIPFEPLWEQYRRIAKPNAAILLTANNPFSSALVSSAFDLFKYSWVWIKNRPTGAQHSKNRPMSNHEDILVFSKAPMGHVSQLGDRRMKYNPQGVSAGPMKTVSSADFSNITGQRPNQYGKTYQSMTGFPQTCLQFSKDESHLHPTQKPVALMEYMIRTYTNEGETVLDNCMGSGTTGVAALNTNRRFIGIEKDPTYFQIAKERINRTNPTVT